VGIKKGGRGTGKGTSISGGGEKGRPLVVFKKWEVEKKAAIPRWKLGTRGTPGGEKKVDRSNREALHGGAGRISTNITKGGLQANLGRVTH